MKVFVATDVVVNLYDKKIYAKNKYATILNRYYNVFGKIILYSRVNNVEKIDNDCVEITNIVDNIISINSLIRCLIENNIEIMDSIKNCNLVICRCPSISGYKSADIARKLKIPYFTEVMGCAWDAYWNHGLIGKLIAPYMYLKMKFVVKRANYSLYVTSEFLQKRYPRKGSSIGVSNVLIENIDDGILEMRKNKIINMPKDNIKLMTSGAADVRYKGQKYVIECIPKINNAGIKVEYYIVGEGNQSYLKSIAKKYNVENQVIFTGRLQFSEVLKMLDDIDIYIQPSLQEGLPRAVIEAMSRGCIAVGTNTAGIPELIEKKYIVRRKNSDDIAKKIINIINDSTENKINCAKRNFEESKKYNKLFLDERRNVYFRQILSNIKIIDNY